MKLHFLTKSPHWPAFALGLGAAARFRPRQGLQRGEGGDMQRNERYFDKNDGKHNYYGEYESLDQIIDKYQTKPGEESVSEKEPEPTHKDDS